MPPVDEKDLPAELPTGLKEWDAVCRVLAEGRQVFLLRKGGIVDKDGVFSLERRTFALLPTHEHQNPLDVKPAFHPLLKDGPGPEGPFPVSCAARAEDVLSLSADQAARLLPFSVWTEAFLHKRLAYRPDRPLHLVVLRAFRRPDPIIVPAAARYAGCVSWVDLDAAIPTRGFSPVLTDEEFAARRRELLAALA
jgi:hypothetical protein